MRIYSGSIELVWLMVGWYICGPGRRKGGMHDRFAGFALEKTDSAVTVGGFGKYQEEGLSRPRAGNFLREGQTTRFEGYMKTGIRTIGLALVATSFAAMALAQGGSTLQRVVKVGDTMRYRLKAEIELAGEQAVFSALVTERVVRVDPGGDYVVESIQADGKVGFAGQEFEAPPSPPSSTTYRLTGEVVQIRGEMNDENAYRIANLSLVRTPGKSVGVGDTWSHKVAADAKTGGVPIEANYRIEGEEKIGQWDTLKIKMSVRETEGSEPASNEALVWMSKTDGSMVKLESKWTNAPIPGAPGPVNGQITLTRVD
jgi:hypothetical protein